MQLQIRPFRPLIVLALALTAALASIAAPAAVASNSGSGSKYGGTALTLDQTAVDALTGLGVTPAPIPPATATSNGKLVFPITNSFGETLRTGVIRHSGGISLTAGGTTVPLEDFNIDLLRKRLTARVGSARLPILKLDFSKSRVSPGYRGVRIGPVGGFLTDTAAGALDGAFGLAPGTVPPGLKLGDATVNYRLF
jgi:hypothetical protein